MERRGWEDIVEAVDGAVLHKVELLLREEQFLCLLYKVKEERNDKS